MPRQLSGLFELQRDEAGRCVRERSQQRSLLGSHRIGSLYDFGYVISPPDPLERTSGYVENSTSTTLVTYMSMPTTDQHSHEKSQDQDRPFCGTVLSCCSI